MAWACYLLNHLMPVTLKQIATETGLSLPTVSHVLRGRKGFAPRTQQRVREAAARLGYRPNTSAQSMRSGRFGQIALLTRREMGLVQLNLNKGVFAAAAERDLHLSYAEIEFERLDDDDYAPKVLTELCADGFLVHYAWQIPEASIDHIRGYGMPTIWINTNADHDCVYPDDRQGARLATEQLLQRGHRRVLYVDRLIEYGRPRHYSAADRSAGYTDAMRDVGFTPVTHTVKQYPDGFAEGVSLWRDVLAAYPDATAVVCPSISVASSLVIAAAALGREVPRDLSVVAFSNTGGDPFDHGMTLSVIEVPMRDVGNAAVDVLQAKIIKPGKPAASVAVPYQPPTEGTLFPPHID